MPIGKRRSRCHQISRAKAAETKQNRIGKLFDLLYDS
ncbi:YdeI/OmpD-associated family protein [Cognatiyoonia sp. IB215182]|nr:YdeI/OmpD-associated family protein [Cognatiyoonia sp. IB215182]MDX8354442.1 YdeI/OmpD-associated family protein [Cognatiyoonia sp. IB215182]